MTSRTPAVPTRTDASVAVGTHDSSALVVPSGPSQNSDTSLSPRAAAASSTPSHTDSSTIPTNGDPSISPSIPAVVLGTPDAGRAPPAPNPADCSSAISIPTQAITPSEHIHLSSNHRERSSWRDQERNDRGSPAAREQRLEALSEHDEHIHQETVQAASLQLQVDNTTRLYETLTAGIRQIAVGQERHTEENRLIMAGQERHTEENRQIMAGQKQIMAGQRQISANQENMMEFFSQNPRQPVTEARQQEQGMQTSHNHSVPATQQYPSMVPGLIQSPNVPTSRVSADNSPTPMDTDQFADLDQPTHLEQLVDTDNFMNGPVAGSSVTSGRPLVGIAPAPNVPSIGSANPTNTRTNSSPGAQPDYPRVEAIQAHSTIPGAPAIVGPMTGSSLTLGGRPLVDIAPAPAPTFRGIGPANSTDADPPRVGAIQAHSTISGVPPDISARGRDHQNARLGHGTSMVGPMTDSPLTLGGRPLVRIAPAPTARTDRQAIPTNAHPSTNLRIRALRPRQAAPATRSFLAQQVSTATPTANDAPVIPAYSDNPANLMDLDQLANLDHSAGVRIGNGIMNPPDYRQSHSPPADPPYSSRNEAANQAHYTPSGPLRVDSPASPEEQNRRDTDIEQGASVIGLMAGSTVMLSRPSANDAPVSPTCPDISANMMDVDQFADSDHFADVDMVEDFVNPAHQNHSPPAASPDAPRDEVVNQAHCTPSGPLNTGSPASLEERNPRGTGIEQGASVIGLMTEPSVMLGRPSASDAPMPSACPEIPTNVMDVDQLADSDHSADVNMAKDLVNPPHHDQNHSPPAASPGTPQDVADQAHNTPSGSPHANSPASSEDHDYQDSGVEQGASIVGIITGPSIKTSRPSATAVFVQEANETRRQSSDENLGSFNQVYQKLNGRLDTLEQEYSEMMLRLQDENSALRRGNHSAKRAILSDVRKKKKGGVSKGIAKAGLQKSQRSKNYTIALPAQQEIPGPPLAAQQEVPGPNRQGNRRLVTSCVKFSFGLTLSYFFLRGLQRENLPQKFLDYLEGTSSAAQSQRHVREVISSLPKCPELPTASIWGFLSSGFGRW